MSKNISIQQDGTPTSLPSTSEIVAGGIYGSTWIPEDETQLSDISVTENGTYSAAELGYYGFHTVNVNVPTEEEEETPETGFIGYAIVGRDINDGKDYMVYIDDDGYVRRTLFGTPFDIVDDQGNPIDARNTDLIGYEI